MIEILPKIIFKHILIKLITKTNGDYYKNSMVYIRHKFLDINIIAHDLVG